MSDKGHSPDSNGRDYQDRDIRIKPILIFGVFTAITVFATFVGMKVYFHGFASQQELKAQPLSIEARQLPTGPTLQVWELADLEDYRAREYTVTHNYAWLDRANGVVQIPVERAMERVLEKGFPVRETKPTP